MRVRTSVTTLLAAALLLAAAAGCRTRPSDEGLSASGPEPGDRAADIYDSEPETVTDPFGSGTLRESDLAEEDLAPASTDKSWAEGRLETVYFEFDRSSLTEEARAALDRNAAFLTQNRGLRIRIEGHCDERGTVEYNLALGDRRASSVKEYLVARGVDGAALSVVSFGEERPADPGRSEAAWARNRRAEFHVE